MDSISASTLAGRGVAYASAITAAARDHGLDPTLLAAVAAQETGGPGSNAGRNVVGDGGHGRGLFQIDDRYHAFARSSEAMDPGENARYAAGMLSGLISRYGSVHRALSAYNAGNPDAVGTVTQWGDGRQLGYADSVLRHQRDISDSTGDDAVTTAREELASTTGSVNALGQQASASLGLTLPPPAHRHSYRDLLGDAHVSDSSDNP